MNHFCYAYPLPVPLYQLLSVLILLQVPLRHEVGTSYYYRTMGSFSLYVPPLFRGRGGSQTASPDMMLLLHLSYRHGKKSDCQIPWGTNNLPQCIPRLCCSLKTFPLDAGGYPLCSAVQRTPSPSVFPVASPAALSLANFSMCTEKTFRYTFCISFMSLQSSECFNI